MAVREPAARYLPPLVPPPLPVPLAYALDHPLLQCPDGIFAALAVHLAHKARGVAVDWRPNTVYAPLSVADLALQVGSPDLFGHQL